MRTQLYINGQWVPGASTVAVTDPSDGSVIAQVSIADDVQCEAAIAAADADMAGSFASEDFKEGVAHFLEKRPARFTGR